VSSGAQAPPRPAGRRRRRQQGLERVLGTPALFATAYGNVGSSIYYALGVTAGIALGLTPLVFVISGLIFAATAATYAEGTVRYPEAGGSSSFARHAFNELVSFGAAWAQMLNYIITIAISAFFVPHYLSIFWEPLKTTPWDVIGGAVVIVLLVGLNVVGIREAASLNIFLAVIDFATQLLLVIVGFALIFSPHQIFSANLHWGVAPTWSHFFLAIPVAMIAYTGIETVSNLAEEARDPPRNIPASIRLVAIAVFAIYFTLPLIALSALPVVKDSTGHYVTKLGLSPDKHGFKNDPVLGLVNNLHLHGAVLRGAQYYVGILAATILFIATNAGVIGASRITYSMSTYRQLPEVFRRLHPKFKTPWLSLVVFAGLASIIFILPGNVDFIGRMYAFGAMLSFTIAHASVIQLRRRYRDEELVFRAKPNLRVRGVDWPLFAVLGGIGTGIAWLVVVVQDAPTRYAGLAWLAVGFVIYTVYRRRLGQPLRVTVRAPVVIGPGAALEYRSILVPVKPGRISQEAVDVACRLAAERRATIVALAVVVVPLELPLDAPLPDEEAQADAALDAAVAIGELYGVDVTARLVRARSAGRAIVDEAKRRRTQIIVMGAPRLESGRGGIFSDTVDFVLKHAPSRVMVAAGRKAAA
jgi:basic amino acid/polyamine antiporter, APA family